MTPPPAATQRTRPTLCGSDDPPGRGAATTQAHRYRAETVADDGAYEVLSAPFDVVAVNLGDRSLFVGADGGRPDASPERGAAARTLSVEATASGEATAVATPRGNSVGPRIKTFGPAQVATWFVLDCDDAAAMTTVPKALTRAPDAQRRATHWPTAVHPLPPRVLAAGAAAVLTVRHRGTRLRFAWADAPRLRAPTDDAPRRAGVPRFAWPSLAGRRFGGARLVRRLGATRGRRVGQRGLPCGPLGLRRDLSERRSGAS